MAASKSIVVIGSINMDLVCRTPVSPRPGETVLGSEFLTLPGGKGANQAVAAVKLARRGTKVHMIGRVGDDAFGRTLLAGLKRHGVDTKHIVVTRRVASGIAMILVDRKGENSIVVSPGANHRVTPEDIDAAEDLIRSASAAVLQLEIPLPTVRHAIAMCRRLGVFTILDPAPAPAALPRDLYRVDVLTPNETEAAQLLGRKKAAAALLAHGAKSVVLKLGSRGSMLIDRSGKHVARSFKVKVIDTTAAGDAFTAALAVAHAEGMPLRDALRFANAAGAACCQSVGAQPSLPARREVEKLLR